ncbi:MAG: hypothetical protein MHPSP_001223, partial [Paramarteilia canceri]
MWQNNPLVEETKTSDLLISFLFIEVGLLHLLYIPMYILSSGEKNKRNETICITFIASANSTRNILLSLIITEVWKKNEAMPRPYVLSLDPPKYRCVKDRIVPLDGEVFEQENGKDFVSQPSGHSCSSAALTICAL